MNIALDIIVVILIIGCLYGGIKNGFIKSVLGFFSNIIALVVAFFASAPVGEYISEKWVTPALEQQTLETINRLTGEQAATAADAPIEKILSGPQGVLDSFMKGISTTVEQIQNAFSQGGDLAAARENAVRAVTAPAADGISRVIAFIGIFIVMLIIIFVVTKLLSGLFSLPVLRSINGLLGFVFGALKGVVLVFAFCSLISFAMPYTANFDQFSITDETIEDTLVFQTFYDNNFLPNANPGEQN